MAFACRPRLIVLDEPTTGLDVTTQAHVLGTVRELAAAARRRRPLRQPRPGGGGHAGDPGGGDVRRAASSSSGSADELFASAAHPYTRRLVGAIPRLSGGRELVGHPRPGAVAGHAPAGLRVRAALRARRSTTATAGAAAADRAGRRPRRTLHPRRRGARPAGAALRRGRARSAAVDGDGGARAIENVSAGYGRLRGPARDQHDAGAAGVPGAGRRVGIGQDHDGRGRSPACTASWTGRDPARRHGRSRARPARRPREARRHIQYIFQNPYGSLNPRRTIGQIVRQPLEVFGIGGKEADRRVGRDARAGVADGRRTPAATPTSSPAASASASRSRARWSASPAVLICDEVTSALDVSVQAAIVELLGALQRDLGLAMLFVTHNLPLVRSIAQRVAVMSEGRIVELGHGRPGAAGPDRRLHPAAARRHPVDSRPSRRERRAPGRRHGRRRASKRVREAFGRTSRERGDGGCAFAAVVDGRTVVDLWGGIADGARRALDRGDGGGRLLGHQGDRRHARARALSTRGVLDLGARRRGLAGVRRRRQGVDHGRQAAAHTPPGCRPWSSRWSAPTWPTRSGSPRCSRLSARWSRSARPCYHAVTFGWLAGELLRRADGRTAGRLLAGELAGPPASSLTFGTAPSVRGAARSRDLRPLPDFQLSAFLADDPDPAPAAGVREPATPDRRLERPPTCWRSRCPR